MLFQLALPYPVNDEKAKAKFDKTKRVLTITLPVVPPPPPPPQSFEPPCQPPLVSEIHQDATNQPSQEHENILEPLNRQDEDESCVSVNGNKENKEAESSEDPPPELNETNQSSAFHQGEWSSTGGEWVCPPFSYRQEDDTVAFCLHTPGVKENTLVKHFDDHCVSDFTEPSRKKVRAGLCTNLNGPPPYPKATNRAFCRCN